MCFAVAENTYVAFLSCRDSLESVTCLYNQVEEAVHTLVMKSNQSLQHLEHVLLFRETEDSLSTVCITSHYWMRVYDR